MHACIGVGSPFLSGFDTCAGGITHSSPSTQRQKLRSCQNREIGKRVLGGLWAYSQEPSDINTDPR